MVGAFPLLLSKNLCNVNMEHPTQSAETEEICVGSRVRCDESIGTVKYIGEVSGYKGLWYGVDWDDDSRGKHDGSVGDVKYFEARSWNSGSFVRPNKLIPSQSCADAIRRYYGEKEDEDTAALYQAVIDDWKKQIKVPFIEMIGFDSVQQKQGTLDKLLEACVGDRCVSVAGDLASLCPMLQTLDVSRNLLADWKSIAVIVTQLSHLTTLDLSKNRLKLPTSNNEIDKFAKCFENLRKIVLTHCNLEWQDVERISKMLPRIEEIVLAYNNISNVATLTDGMFSNVTSVVLDGNHFVSWEDILNLGVVENLKVLSLNDCGIKEVRFDNSFNDEKARQFSNVEVLHLKQNMLNDWRSVSELNKLSALQKLYFLKNPILKEDDYDTCCQLVIARIGNLKELNGSEIAKEIRRGAEYDYLKKHGKSWKKLEADSHNAKEFLLEHSRFQQLVAKHGLPEDSLLELKENSWAINNRLIEIFLQDEVTGVLFKKKLPSSMTVQKLSALVRRLFSMKNIGAKGSPILYCRYTNKCDDSDNMIIPLDNQLKGLDYYSVNNGDIVLVKWR